MSDPVRPAATSNPDLTGRTLGDYQILRRLGSGGMAEVYLAQQQSLGRQVALKVLSQALASDSSYVQRFQNEARAAASLVHPNIVQIYEVGNVQGVHFIAQEYVAGKNLGQLLQRQGAFQPALVLDIMRQVTSALCKASELGIVHRDIKPENILLNHSGEVKVADFGLARVQSDDSKTLTQVGVTLGTPLYMSPEQVEGRPTDARSDIYSLGVSCYHLLAGEPPHTAETALAIAIQHLQGTPRPLENVRADVPSGLARIVHKMLAKKPESRYSSPSELLLELRELASLASREGWGTGPEEWSLAEWIATEPSRTRKGEELARYMQAEAELAKRRKKPWRRVAMGIAGAVLVGALLALVTRKPFYLAASPRQEEVPELDSAWAQLYHAQMYGREAAWHKAVEFPDADPFVQQLARRGLVRYYLLVSQNYDAALQELAVLENYGSSDSSTDLVHAFTLAGRCVCYENLGRREDAIGVQQQLDASMRDVLQEYEPQISDLLRASLERLGV